MSKREGVARLLALLILPLAAWPICRTLERERGPLWLGTNSDPSYQYLVSALMITHGMTPGHVDHPGTTSQVLGAAVVATVAAGADVEEQSLAVLAEPEPMLAKIVRVHWALAGAALVLGGGLVLERTGSLVLALLVQGMPLLQVGTYRALLFYAPEALLLPLGFLLAVLLLVQSHEGGQRRFGILDVALAVTAAAGVVTKVTFAPLCLLPLLMQTSWRRAGLVLVIMVIAVGGFVAPVLTELPRLFRWFVDLATHRGVYGTGEPGWIDWAAYPTNIWRISGADRLLLPVLLVSGIVGIAGWRRRNEDEKIRRWSSRLLIVTAVQFVGFLLVGKHPHHVHYLLPLAVSCAFNVGVGWELAKSATSRRWVGLAASLAVILALSALGVDLRRCAMDFRRVATAQGEMKATADATPALRIDYYRSSSPQFALYFGDSFAQHFFGRSLDRIYPGCVFYNVFENRFETFRYRLPPEAVGERGRALIMHGDQNIEGATLPAGVATTLLADNGTARLLRLNIAERQGNRGP